MSKSTRRLVLGLLCWSAFPGSCRPSATEVIVFAAHDGELGTRHLWMIDARGQSGAVTRLTDGPVIDDAPRVSPDGRWLAFSRTRGPGDGSHRIWIRSLAANVEAEITNPSPEWTDRAPFWHPAGTELGFSRDRRAVAGTARLWKVALAMSGATVRASGPPIRLSPATGLSRIMGSWNPASGSDIAFANEVGGFNPFAIWRLDSSGGETEIVPHGCCGNVRPRYAPDGHRIAFVSFQRSEAGDIHVVNADGTGATRVTCDPGWGDVDWSPDSRELVVVPSTGPPSGVWRVRAPAARGECASPVQVLPIAIRAITPTWARITERRQP